MALLVHCKHCAAVLDGLAEYERHARTHDGPYPHRVQLAPRGTPDTGTRWADPRPRWIAVAAETETAWYGTPLDNPACPTLEYPRFAWVAVREIGGAA